MAKRYFKLTDDMTSPERWLLDNALDAQGNEVGSRLFLNEEPTRFDGRLRIPIYLPGTPLDFSFADDGDFHVVTEKVASVLADLAPDDVQLYPAEVDSRPEPYFLVNVARLVKCIDDEASAEVLYWKPEDERPDKVGQYRDVYGMRIDPSKVGEVKVFRPWGYPGTLIVAEDIKDALERTGATGLDFTEVTGPSPISEEERAYKRKCNELLDPPSPRRQGTHLAFVGLVGHVGEHPRGDLQHMAGSSTTLARRPSRSRTYSPCLAWALRPFHLPDGSLRGVRSGTRGGGGPVPRIRWGELALHASRTGGE